MLVAISLGFIVNMAFVIVSRTAMVTIPIMLAVFALLHLKWRTSLMIFCATGRPGGIGLGRVAALAADAGDLRPRLPTLQEGQRADVGRAKAGISGRNRCSFLPKRRSIGNGTGSTRGLVRAGRHRRGPISATGQVIGNPHNQTLAVAVQWGAAGIVLLYAMWLAHLLLFRGDGLVAWIGLLVVVQNIFTSLFNSHIFDFHEGWMYVLGVGVAGGMTLAAGQRNAGGEPAGS